MSACSLVCVRQQPVNKRRCPAPSYGLSNVASALGNGRSRSDRAHPIFVLQAICIMTSHVTFALFEAHSEFGIFTLPIGEYRVIEPIFSIKSS
jgi:hypothetical protein